MDKIKVKLSKKGSQSAVNINGYYKRGASNSLGRNIEHLAEQFNKNSKEEFKLGKQLTSGKLKAEFKGKWLYIQHTFSSL